MSITTLEELNGIDFEKIQEDSFWNDKKEKEVKIHKVHIYPAKFPSLIAQRAFDYAEKQNLSVKKVADIFCGCGTVGVEALRKGYDFWGCDINPVAILLSKVKTEKYNVKTVEKYQLRVEARYVAILAMNVDYYVVANERLRHWYGQTQYNKLYALKEAINSAIPLRSKYNALFLCIFSSILKGTSKWLTSSIKPQIDPHKAEHDVLTCFKKQCKVFIDAIDEENYPQNVSVKIQCKNVLSLKLHDYVDMIVTSPPYVTSYEYADLHQLSTLWLGFTDDYTTLRKDSIGTQYGVSSNQVSYVCNTAKKITSFFPEGAQKNSIGKYYTDMIAFTKKCYQLLIEGGICIFVIGDTEYKQRKIENARCLAESLILNGFIIEEISKRRIENKFLPSHRDANGKFSSNKSDRQIYSQEYIIIGRKRDVKRTF